MVFVFIYTHTHTRHSILFRRCRARRIDREIYIKPTGGLGDWVVIVGAAAVSKIPAANGITTGRLRTRVETTLGNVVSVRPLRVRFWRLIEACLHVAFNRSDRFNTRIIETVWFERQVDASPGKIGPRAN